MQTPVGRHGKLAAENICIGVVLPRAEHEIIKAAAKLEDRSVSKWCALVLERAAEEFLTEMSRRDGGVQAALDRDIARYEEHLKLEEIDQRHPDLVDFAPPVKRAIAARRARSDAVPPPAPRKSPVASRKA